LRNTFPILLYVSITYVVVFVKRAIRRCIANRLVSEKKSVVSTIGSATMESICLDKCRKIGNAVNEKLPQFGGFHRSTWSTPAPSLYHSPAPVITIGESSSSSRTSSTTSKSATPHEPSAGSACSCRFLGSLSVYISEPGTTHFLVPSVARFAWRMIETRSIATRIPIP